MPVTTGTFAQQPENKIPDWVKTTAGWWADGAIDGTSFAQGIQYLIKEDIIIIPETTQGTSSGTDEIPDWVKNNAGWWADDVIDESSFVSSMQYLIEEGVVQISSAENSTPPETEPDTPVEKSQSNNAQKNNNQNNKDKMKTVKDFKTIFNDEKFLSKAEKKQNKHDRLALEANTEGYVRVIVELDVDFKSKLTKQEKIDKKQTIKTKQNSLRNILSSDGILSAYHLKYSPLIVMTVNPTVLDELISSGLVKTIHEDVVLYPSLDNTIPLVGANIAPASDVDGTGTVVAILDSGVDNTHDFFTTGGSRIVFEGCYTGDFGTINVPAIPSSCPFGENGTDAAIPCSPNIACDHGTHVAGIAAGSRTGTDPSSGVATGVGIAAYQIFTLLPSTYIGTDMVLCPAGKGCMVGFGADIVRALDSVTVLVNDGCPLLCDEVIPPMKIVAVNMSFSGEFPFTSVFDPLLGCNAGDLALLLKGPIDTLRADGVVTIASSGNRGNSNAMESPACISSVVSVSSTDRFDVIPKYSNLATFLDFVAPGGNAVCGAITATCFTDQGTDDGVRSSVPGNTYGSKSGTSFAAPHLTGAWALIKSSSDFAAGGNYPDPSINQTLHVLKKTGVILPHPATALTTPRIQIDLAINALIHLKDCIVDIEDIDNIIFGTSGGDRIYGTSNNDLILGFAGDDFINGNEGNDCLFGGSGLDNLSGGIGNDYLNGSSGADNLLGRAGNDVIFGGAGIDHIDGGPGNDELHGGPGVDHISGRAGDDSLFGDDGDDFLDGGADGDSELNGGPGDDSILGRGGIDVLIGGDGAADVCAPGDGEDVDSTCEIIK